MSGTIDPKLCADCGATLSARNKIGYCAKHCNAALARRPEWREAHKQGLKWHYFDPANRAKAAEKMRRNGSTEHAKQARRDSCIRGRIWEKGNAVQTPGSEARIKAGKRRTATVLAWCPSELRDEYRRLVRSRRLSAAAAKELILQKNREDIVAFGNDLRQRLAAKNA